MPVRLSVEVGERMAERIDRARDALGMSREAFLVAALDEHLQRLHKAEMRQAKKRERVDERLLARLRSLVAGALEDADDWADAQRALAQHGLAFSPRGRGLVIVDRSGKTLAKASEVGPSYAALVRRFQRPFPGLGMP